MWLRSPFALDLSLAALQLSLYRGGGLLLQLWLVFPPWRLFITVWLSLACLAPLPYMLAFLPYLLLSFISGLFPLYCLKGWVVLPCLLVRLGGDRGEWNQP